MDPYATSHISNAALRHEVRTGAANDCKSTAVLLSRLGEFDARKLYREEGYPSMHSYCVQELHFCEGTASWRIYAARAARRFPVLFDAVADGRLHLTAVVMLRKYLTSGNVDDPRSARVREITEARRGLRGPLLPVLHAVNDELGHIDKGDVAIVADVLNIAVAEVHGVVTFYEDFRTAPSGRSTVRICRAEACQSVGAEALFKDTRARASSLAADVEVSEVFCLGNCALGPSGTLDGRLHGRLSPERLDALTEGWR